MTFLEVNVILESTQQYEIFVNGFHLHCSYICKVFDINCLTLLYFILIIFTYINVV